MRIVIVGGGSGGIAVAARLRRAEPKCDIVLIDPAAAHFYQPLWTLVGGGLATFSETERAEQRLIPDNVTWMKEQVVEFLPDKSQVITQSGQRVDYDQLVVAPGLRLAFEEVLGLSDALEHDPWVWTNYDARYVTKGPQAIAGVQEGRALFTTPDSPLKCGGAPQKIMWICEEWFRKNQVRDVMSVELSVPGAAIFGIPKYREQLEKLASERGVQLHTKEHLVEVDSLRKVAVFENLDTGEENSRHYSLLHVTPPQRALPFISQSPLANHGGDASKSSSPALARRGIEQGTRDGFVDVDIHTLQHKKFKNVWSLGDSANLPTAKTGAAVRKQAPVLVHNLLATAAGKTPDATYDGYTSCPLVVGHDRVILAEFGYDGKVMETFPFDQSKPRYSSWLLKRHLLPPIYWQGMMKGLM